MEAETVERRMKLRLEGNCYEIECTVKNSEVSLHVSYVVCKGKGKGKGKGTVSR